MTKPHTPQLKVKAITSVFMAQFSKMFCFPFIFGIRSFLIYGLSLYLYFYTQFVKINLFANY